MTRIPASSSRRTVSAGAAVSVTSVTSVYTGSAAQIRANARRPGLLLAMTGAIREFLATRPDTVDPRRYLAAGREAIARTVAGLIEALGPPVS
jgi:fructose-bisphosphate aldolase class II